MTTLPASQGAQAGMSKREYPSILLPGQGTVPYDQRSQLLLTLREHEGKLTALVDSFCKEMQARFTKVGTSTNVGTTILSHAVGAEQQGDGEAKKKDEPAVADTTDAADSVATAIAAAAAAAAANSNSNNNSNGENEKDKVGGVAGGRSGALTLVHGRDLPEAYRDFERAVRFLLEKYKHELARTDGAANAAHAFLLYRRIVAEMYNFQLESLVHNWGLTVDALDAEFFTLEKTVMQRLDAMPGTTFYLDASKPVLPEYASNPGLFDVEGHLSLYRTAHHAHDKAMQHRLEVQAASEEVRRLELAQRRDQEQEDARAKHLGPGGHVAQDSKHKNAQKLSSTSKLTKSANDLRMDASVVQLSALADVVDEKILFPPAIPVGTFVKDAVQVSEELDEGHARRVIDDPELRALLAQTAFTKTKPRVPSDSNRRSGHLRRADRMNSRNSNVSRKVSKQNSIHSPPHDDQYEIHHSQDQSPTIVALPMVGSSGTSKVSSKKSSKKLTPIKTPRRRPDLMIDVHTRDVARQSVATPSNWDQKDIMDDLANEEDDVHLSVLQRAQEIASREGSQVDLANENEEGKDKAKNQPRRNIVVDVSL